MKVTETKPLIHDFRITGNEDELPEFLGEFENINMAKVFVSKNFISEHIKTTATRLYTNVEIQMLRGEIHEELEEKQFELKEKLTVANSVFEEAKRSKNDAEEAVRASMTKVKDLSSEIREGTTKLSIEPSRIFRLAVNGKYYSYVYTDDFKLVLCDVSGIPEHERKDLFNSSTKNEEAFKNLMDGEIKEQKGA